MDKLKTRLKTYLLGLLYNRANDPIYIDISIHNINAADGNLLNVLYPRTNKFKRAPNFQESHLWIKLCAKTRMKQPTCNSNLN